MAKPAFDPNQPFEAIAAASEGSTGASKPAFDPNKPFEEAKPLDKEFAPGGGSIVAAKGVGSSADAPATGGPWAVTRGFVSGIRQQNPELAGEALEVASELGPESLKAPLRAGADYMRSVAAGSPEAYKTRSPGLFESQGVGDVATWAGETLGSGLASTVPSIVTGLGGAAAGSVIGPAGTVGGGLAGAAVPSLALSAGEIYKALKEEKVAPAIAARYAAFAAVPTAALDVASLGSIVGKVGIQAAKAEVTRSIAKRIALGIAQGAGTEGVTEAIQEGIKDATVSAASDKPFLTMETAKGVTEAGLGGALVGGSLGGTHGLTPTKKPDTSPGASEDDAKILKAQLEADAKLAAAPQMERQLNLPFTAPPPVGGQHQLELGDLETPPLPEARRPGPPPPPAAAAPPAVIPAPTATAEGQTELPFPRTLAPGEQGELPLNVPPGPVQGPPRPPQPGIIPVETPSQREQLIGDLFGPENVAAVEKGAETAVNTVAPGASRGALLPTSPYAPKWADVAPQITPAEPAPIFYSKLRNFVETRGPGVASAGQWNRTLAQAGLKKEELVDTRIHELLMGAPDRKLTNREILQHIDENSIRVHEEVRSSVEPPLAVKEAMAMAQWGKTPEEWRAIPMPHRHQLMYRTMMKWRMEQGPRYSDYTTPGVRDEDVEIVMSIPERPEVNASSGYRIQHLPGARHPFVIFDQAGRRVTDHVDQAAAERMLNHYDRTARQQAGSPNFETQHFPGIKNPIAHVRMSVRKDRDGATYALVEEIQSDWLQKGRQFGFKGDPVVWKDTPSLTGRPSNSVEAKYGPQPEHIIRINNFTDAVDPTKRYFVSATLQGKSQYVATLEEAKAFGEEMINSVRVPPAPFKETWAEMTFKRVLRWAADRGIQRVSWSNSEEQMRRYPPDLDVDGNMEAAGVRRQQGMEKFYDQDIPRIVKKMARDYGGTVSTVKVEGSVESDIQYAVYDANGVRHFAGRNITREDVAEILVANNFPGGSYKIDPDFKMQQEFGMLELPTAAIPFIQQGQPRYAHTAGPSKVTLSNPDPANPAQTELVTPLVNALQKIATNLNLGLNINVVLHDKVITYMEGGEVKQIMGPLGLAVEWNTNNPSIHIAVGNHQNALELWSTMTHELGHLVESSILLRATPFEQLSIVKAYEDFRKKNPDSARFNDVIQRRDNVLANYFNTKKLDPNAKYTLGDVRNISAEQYEYWSGFSEWFAEQVAKWATTNEKPLSTVEKFFAGIADVIKKIARQSLRLFGMPANAEPAVAMWLNKHYHDGPQLTIAGAGQQAQVMADATTVKSNKDKMKLADTAVALQQETIAGRQSTSAAFNGRPPREVQVASAYADKFNWMYKYGVGIHQLSQANSHIGPLKEYTETLAVAQLTKQQIMIGAQEVEKAWNKLGEKQADAVAAMIDDMVNMGYRTKDEVARGIARFPTEAELKKMAETHGVSQRGMAVVGQVSESFSSHLTRYEAIMRQQANQIADPIKLRQAHESINQQMSSLRNRPYFPAMHFGDFTITIHDDAKNVIHFETFETKRRQNLAAEELKKKYNIPDERMILGKLESQVRPLMGVPKEILRMMETRLDLDKSQRDAMKALQFDLSPTQSFNHKYQYKKRLAGYSQDFRRAYASYFFYGANHFMRVQYADQMRALITQTREEVSDATDIRNRQGITAYMSDHIKNWLDPKPDWAALRSVAFMWSLAFSPATAAQNLTQTLMTTYPFLASKFGDAKAVSAMTRAGADFTTFYKKGTLAKQTSFELKALGQGIKDGTITEAMAPELAGYAESRTLGIGMGHNVVQRGLNKVNEYGSFMFEMAEQTNRRLVFRATLKLAQENPNAAFIKEMVSRHKLQYDALIAADWTEAHASAYVAAKAATEDTQFHYGKEYAPRFMRGKLRSVFVFKTFIQNYVMFLINYPSAAIRSVLIMGLLGGLMGVPGSEDLKEILKAIGWRVFGKSFDLEKEARAAIIAAVGDDEFGRNAGDLALHGIARRGFGIPTVMDMLGATVGVDIPMPTFDRSRAVSAGTLLPVELGTLFGPPTQSADKVIAGQAQKASGALFGAGFNIYKALTDSQRDWGDSKRWERAVPRGISSVTKAYRLWNEGQERSSTGSQVVSYNVRDPEQMMEVLGVAAGYVPLRQSLEWDRILAQQDAVKLWHIRREGLMRQFGNAALGQDEKEMEQVRGAIVAFNQGLPQEARGQAITSESLQKSVKMKAMNRAAQEGDLSLRKSDIPVMRKVQALYPESKAREPRLVSRDLTPSE